MASYLMGRRHSMASHIVGSTSMFVNAVNAIVAGALGGLITYAAGAPAWLISVIGGLSGLGYLGVSIVVGRRTFGVLNSDSRFPRRPAVDLPESAGETGSSLSWDYQKSALS
jgi:hypothetical protein